MATGVAVQADRAASEDAAVEIRAELALDEPGHRSSLLACIGEEGLEVLSYDLVEQCLVGLVTFVVDGWGSSGDRAPRQKSKSRAALGAGVGRLLAPAESLTRGCAADPPLTCGNQRSCSEPRATDSPSTPVHSEPTAGVFRGRRAAMSAASDDERGRARAVFATNQRRQ